MVLINVEKDTTVTMYSAGVTLVSEGLIVGQVDTYVNVYEDKAKTREKTNPGLIGDGDLMCVPTVLNGSRSRARARPAPPPRPFRFGEDHHPSRRSLL